MEEELLSALNNVLPDGAQKGTNEEVAFLGDFTLIMKDLIINALPWVLLKGKRIPDADIGKMALTSSH